MDQGSIADAARPSWVELPLGARVFRLAHLGWGIVSLAALARIWWGVATGRRGRAGWASVAWLVLEGVALVIGRGDCPAGSLQRRLGDPVPMFELVLPPRAAKAAIPVLLVVSLAGIAGLLAPRRSAAPSR
ncbi:MAG: hypothetical protein U0869_14030 [Chloroflexota bacterium]